MGHKTHEYPYAIISTGNTKLGDIDNVSLTPCKSCLPSAPCKAQCYALKAYRMYSSVRDCWNANLFDATHERSGYFDGIEKHLSKRKPRFFRWHVAGDILDQDYLDRMVDVASRFPEVKFLAFTKRHDLKYLCTPRNLQIVFSMWPGFGSTRKRSIRRAWMQDGTETRVPADAIECPGHCDMCGMCWSLDSIGRDVVFHKH